MIRSASCEASAAISGRSSDHARVERSSRVAADYEVGAAHGRVRKHLPRNSDGLPSHPRPRAHPQPAGLRPDRQQDSPATPGGVGRARACGIPNEPRHFAGRNCCRRTRRRSAARPLYADLVADLKVESIGVRLFRRPSVGRRPRRARSRHRGGNRRTAPSPRRLRGTAVVGRRVR